MRISLLSLVLLLAAPVPAFAMDFSQFRRSTNVEDARAGKGTQPYRWGLIDLTDSITFLGNFQRDPGLASCPMGRAAQSAAGEILQGISEKSPLTTMPRDGDIDEDPRFGANLAKVNIDAGAQAATTATLKDRLVRVQAARATLESTYGKAYEKAKRFAAQGARMNFDGCKSGPYQQIITLAVGRNCADTSCHQKRGPVSSDAELPRYVKGAGDFLTASYEELLHAIDAKIELLNMGLQSLPASK